MILFIGLILIIINLNNFNDANTGFIDSKQPSYIMYKNANVSCSYFSLNQNSSSIVWGIDFKVLNTSLFEIVEKENVCQNKSHNYCATSYILFSPLCEYHIRIYQCFLIPRGSENFFTSFPHQDKVVSMIETTLVIIRMDNISCNNRDVNIECEIQSNISPSQIWIQKANKELYSTIVEVNKTCHSSIGTVSVTLKSVDDSHSGEYSCFAVQRFSSNVKRSSKKLRVIPCSLNGNTLSRNNYVQIVVLCGVLFPVLILALVLSLLIRRRCRRRRSYNSLANLRNSMAKIVLFSNNNSIDLETLTLSHSLGEGEFGIVFLGTVFLRGCARPENVAVKVLKYDSSVAETQDFGRELDIMKSMGVHKNVIKYLGYENNEGTFRIIMEYATNGTLLELLRKHRYKFQELSESILIQFAIDVASGMEYLSSLKLVHRDLAARNVLVGDDWSLKIADFGLTRSVSAYYRQTSQGKVPVRWLSLESIMYKMYTTMSDVWSFGILMWEIFSLGGVPYPDVVNVSTLAALVSGGKRNKRPEYASHRVWDLMQRTWLEIPSERPTFTELLYELCLEMTMASVNEYRVEE